MAAAFEWSKATYDSSVSAGCWWYTAYSGWDTSHQYGHDLRQDAELREIVRMEWALRPVPAWAEAIVRGAICCIPPCGHYTFPLAYLRVVDAIGSQTPITFHYACYTADATRKREAQDYCLCLDGWLAGAGAGAVASELQALGWLKLDWDRVCADLWAALGERTRVKELLVERTLMQLRWWIKTLVWPDDLAARFGRDQYLGDWVADGSPATPNGNRGLKAPGFKLDGTPRVQRLDAELAATCPDWPWFRYGITAVDRMNLCAPKTFRYLEYLRWGIGQGRAVPKGETVPGLLAAEHTYPNHDEATHWWREFLAGLRAWWQDQPPVGAVGTDLARRLGPRMPLKEWLVRLYLRRLELHETCAEVGRLVNPKPGARRGRKPLCLD
jgi:hypothetical protein